MLCIFSLQIFSLFLSLNAPLVIWSNDDDNLDGANNDLVHYCTRLFVGMMLRINTKSK